MNDGLKQRIIGALVLVALAVIFLPVLFDKERIAPVDRATQIPLAPVVVPALIPEPAKAPRKKDSIIAKPLTNGTFAVGEKNGSTVLEPVSDKIKTIATVKKESLIEASSDVNVSSKEKVSSEAGISNAVKVSGPRLGADGLPLSWVLQVASYKQKKQAEALRDILLKKGYRAFIQNVKTSKGQHVRLYLGPELDKSILEKAKKKIDKRYNVESFILSFKNT
jgi:DedD protein